MHPLVHLKERFRLMNCRTNEKITSSIISSCDLDEIQNLKEQFIKCEFFHESELQCPTGLSSGWKGNYINIMSSYESLDIFPVIPTDFIIVKKNLNELTAFNRFIMISFGISLPICIDVFSDSLAMIHHLITLHHWHIQRIVQWGVRLLAKIKFQKS